MQFQNGDPEDLSRSASIKDSMLTKESKDSTLRYVMTYMRVCVCVSTRVAVSRCGALERGEWIARAYQRIIAVVIFVVVVITIVVAIIISAWPSRWCSYGKLVPYGAGDLPKETCSREPLRWEVCSRGLMIGVRISRGSAWETWRRWNSTSFARPRILASAVAWINDSRRRREVVKSSKSSTKLLRFADPRRRGSSRDDRIDGYCDEIISPDFGCFTWRFS